MTTILFAPGLILSLMLGQNQGASSTPPATTQKVGDPTAVRMLIKEAKALEPLAKTDWVKRFLTATEDLPAMPSRALLKDEEKKIYFSAGQAVTLGSTYRDKLVMHEADAMFYYYTRYGSPLAYMRPLDILGQAGFKNLQEKKMLDFGYGTAGHLRLLASLGAVVVGVDVDPLLYSLYSLPIDQGPITGEGGAAGTLTLLYGKFPGDERIKREVADGYDLIISKNTLKMGYIHPSRPADKRQLIDLGVDDSRFVAALHGILKPGGYVMIYNLCPAPSPPDKPFIPWTDGRCPFSKQVIESAGFRVLAFDQEDSPAAREMGHALGWDDGKDSMDLKNDLFASYTLLQKPDKPK